jgi:broad specificity phosphatase PhoE
LLQCNTPLPGKWAARSCLGHFSCNFRGFSRRLDGYVSGIHDSSIDAPHPSPPGNRDQVRFVTGTGQRARIILIRHGQPAIALKPRTGHTGFADYIDAYEAAGLDPASLPPEELRDLVRELDAVFTSDRPRSTESARVLAPHAELLVDPLFAEAPLASPRIPLISLTVPTWAVVARILWHAGYTPGIEGYRKARHRAAQAADILVAHARQSGAAALVAHGYFNAMIGRSLHRRGFSRTGSHRVRYWNAVIYEESHDRGKT